MRKLGKNSYLRNLSITTLSVLTLASCGGGGGGGSAPQSGPREVSQAERDFLAFVAQDGLWRFDISGNYNETYVFDQVPPTLNLKAAADIDGSGVFTLKRSGNTYTEDDCTLDSPYTYNESDLTSEDYTFNANDSCNSDPIFTQVDANTYSVTLTCQGLQDTTVTLTHLSDTPSFNQGSLAFSLDSFSPLNSSADVCGSNFYTHVITTVTPQPNAHGIDDSEEEQTDIEILSPYGSSKVSVLINLQSPVSVDVYNIGSAADLEIASTEFGGSATNPVSFYATSGNVSITQSSSRLVSGSFDVTLDNGSALNGNFTLNLN